jgi:threonine aldolase
MMEVNLISDTITKPTSAMLKRMFEAEVGDDVFGKDPTINALEQKVANMFGHDAAVFCPSGTMTNQIAIRIHTQALDEIICDETSHVYLYELGGYSFNSGVSIQIVRGDNGKMTAEQVKDVIRPEADWYPRSKLVIIENSCNRAGGNYYTIDDIMPIRAVCDQHQMSLHLDGARLFNVLVETGESPRQYGEIFDTISLCLSKGLGAPVGSVLSGPAKLIGQARKVRKVLGGGMRQAGYLAAAGIYALEHHIDRLKIDNARASDTGSYLRQKSYVNEVLPVKTNIVIFKLTDAYSTTDFIEILKSKGILAAPMSHDTVRFVFHLDVTGDMIVRLREVLGSL